MKVEMTADHRVRTGCLRHRGGNNWSHLLTQTWPAELKQLLWVKSRGWPISFSDNMFPAEMNTQITDKTQESGMTA